MSSLKGWIKYEEKKNRSHLIMQYFTSDMVVLITIMALSWLVSFISQYAIMRLAVRMKKQLIEKGENEKFTVFSTYGLGAFPGIIVFLILGSIITVAGEPVLFSADLLLISIWILLLIVIGTLGGHIVIRRNQTIEEK
jgi:hypothetical protein